MSENKLASDVRRTLSDTIFFVLMRLMTSSWIQEEMEYPLMRTISSPTYESTQSGALWMMPSLSINQVRIEMTVVLLQEYLSMSAEYPSINMNYWSFSLLHCVILMLFATMTQNKAVNHIRWTLSSFSLDCWIVLHFVNLQYDGTITSVDVETCTVHTNKTKSV